MASEVPSEAGKSSSAFLTDETPVWGVADGPCELCDLEAFAPCALVVDEARAFGDGVAVKAAIGGNSAPLLAITQGGTDRD